MNIATTNVAAKVAAVVAGLGLILTSFAAFAPAARAQSTTDLQAQISALLAQIAALQAQLNASTGGSTGSAACTFTRSLTMGSSGADVTCLQNYLTATGHFTFAGGATGYFGSITQSAVAAWQAANGVSPAVGYFGPISQAKYRAVAGTTFVPTTPGTTPTVPGVPITGNGLKVLLASDSPNNIALVQAQAIGALAKFVFVNPTSAEIKVTNVYLYEGAKRLTDSAGVSNSAFNFNDTNGVVVVPANSSKSISVLADIANTTSGQQIGVQLVSVASTGTLDTSVVFPINSYTQTVSAATLGAVDFSDTTLPSGSTASAQNDFTVWQNAATISTRAVNLESFQLRNIGSISRTDIRNFRLYVDGVQIGSTVANIASDDTITFDLSSTPKRLETGGRVIKVVGDIIAGSGDTFAFSLRRASDARLIDTDLKQPILATKASATFAAEAAATATIDSGTVSVVKANNSPSSNVSLGASSVKWASYEFRAAGEDVKVESLNVNVNTTTSDDGLDNAKIFLNGVQVGSTKDLPDDTDTEFTFGSSFILTAGAVGIVDIYADAKDDDGGALTSGETVTITLDDGSTNGQGQVSLASVNVPGSDTDGNAITVSSSSLTLTKFSGYGNQTMIAGASNALLGSFTLSTGATEGANVNTLTIALSSDEKGSITDLMLKDHATGAQVGTTKPAPDTSNSFSTNINIPVSGTKTIDIYANIKSGSGIGTIIANADASGTGNSTGTSVDADALNLQTITIGAAGLTGAVNAGTTPADANVIAGASEVKVGSFRFTAQYSHFTIQEVKVKIPANAATSVTAVVLKYKDASGTSQESSQSLSLSSGAVQTHSTATFTGLTFYVPQNSDADIDVYVNLATIASGATTGAAVSVLLDDNEGFKAINSSGGSHTDIGAADLTSAVTSGYGGAYVRKSIPTISSTPITSTLSNGSNQVLGRFTVTADAAGDIGWMYVTFTVNKSTVDIGATSTVKLWKGSNTVGGTFATITGSLVGGLESFPAAAGTDTISFEATAEEQIGAGSSNTYELRGTVANSSSGAEYIDVSIANPVTSIQAGAAEATVLGDLGDADPSFIWTDRSSISTVHSASTADWTNDYLVKTLPITIGSRSVSY